MSKINRRERRRGENMGKGERQVQPPRRGDTGIDRRLSKVIVVRHGGVGYICQLGRSLIGLIDGTMSII